MDFGGLLAVDPKAASISTRKAIKRLIDFLGQTYPCSWVCFINDITIEFLMSGNQSKSGQVR